MTRHINVLFRRYTNFPLKFHFIQDQSTHFNSINTFTFYFLKFSTLHPIESSPKNAKYRLITQSNYNSSITKEKKVNPPKFTTRESIFAKIIALLASNERERKRMVFSRDTIIIIAGVGCSRIPRDHGRF